MLNVMHKWEILASNRQNTCVKTVFAIFVRHFEAFSNEETPKTNKRNQREESVNKRLSWLTLVTRLNKNMCSRNLQNYQACWHG